MLRLQKLHLDLNQPLSTSTSTNINTNIRISFSTPTNRLLKYTLQPCKTKNNKNFYWDQQIAVPDIYSKLGITVQGKRQQGYLFKVLNDEITEGDKNGNNNFDGNQIIGEGRIIVNGNEDIGIWDVINSKGNIVGKLKAQIFSGPMTLAKKLISSGSNLTTTPQCQLKKIVKILRILSIVCKLEEFSLKSGYFCLQIGNTIIKTPQIKSKAGQLVFIQPRQVQLQSNNQNLQIKIYSTQNSNKGSNIKSSSSLTSRLNQSLNKRINNNQQQSQPFAQANLELIQKKRSQKLKLMKDSFEIGQVYVQYRITNRQLINTTNHTQNPNKTISLQPLSTLQQTLTKLRPRSISPLSLNPLPSAYVSIDTSLLASQSYTSRVSNSNRQSTKMNSSMVSKTSTNKRNSVSVLNQNNSIVFPKERRFVFFQDKQNQSISYLDEKIRGLEYSGVGGRYRGASIGIGDKTDFVTGRSIPGVGHYKLPSIWDRY